MNSALARRDEGVQWVSKVLNRKERSPGGAWGAWKGLRKCYGRWIKIVIFRSSRFVMGPRTGTQQATPLGASERFRNWRANVRTVGSNLVWGLTTPLAESADAATLRVPEQLVVGEGEAPVKGQSVKVHYTGKLENGKVFDSSVSRGDPLEFAVGTGQVIPGWDEGILTMRVGGKRQLKIPSKLGYGARGVGPIPPNATLLFDCELVALGSK
eukprot:s813_g7.t1